MYYNTPNVSRLVNTVRKYRIAITLFYLLTALAALLILRLEFVASDEQWWLNESKEFQKTVEKSYATRYVTYLRVHVEHFDDTTKKQLQALQKRLENVNGVEQVDSAFAAYYIYNDSSGDDSMLVKALPVEKFTAKEMREFVTDYAAPYRHYLNEEFSHFNFFLFSDEAIDLSDVEIPFAYELSSGNDEVALSKYTLEIVAMIAGIVLLFRYLFQNYASSLLALFTIGLSTVFTFSLIALITGMERIPVAMILLVVCISLVDYLYFYFRWHVSFYNASRRRAMLKTINRNLHPAFWTSFITLLGLGSLLLVDSAIVKLLSLSVIFASVITYVLNLTLLPALLSYFRVVHPKVLFARFSYSFANAELHYNKNYLKVFLGATLVIILIGGYKLVWGSSQLFADRIQHDVITVQVPFEMVDMDLVAKIEAFEKALKTAHEGVVSVSSVAPVLRQINAVNTGAAMDDQNLMQALFFLELYDMEKGFFSDGAINIMITLQSTDKSAVVDWLTNYEGLSLYFTDIDTLLNSAKADKKLLLGLSLATALVMIGLVMGSIFRTKAMVLVGFIVNAIPIAWFGLVIELLDIALSLEVLIAMTITVGLASDATVHFAYKYYRSRYFGRSQKHSLEIMFFYAGVPVIIGSLILALLFSLLTFTVIESLQLIGGFGAVLILLSLVTDLFILPVLLLAIDKFDRKPYH